MRLKIALQAIATWRSSLQLAAHSNRWIRLPSLNLLQFTPPFSLLCLLLKFFFSLTGCWSTLLVPWQNFFFFTFFVLSWLSYGVYMLFLRLQTNRLTVQNHCFTAWLFYPSPHLTPVMVSLLSTSKFAVSDQNFYKVFLIQKILNNIFMQFIYF